MQSAGSRITQSYNMPEDVRGLFLATNLFCHGPRKQPGGPIIDV